MWWLSVATCHVSRVTCQGCEGVPNNKYTLSSLGGPCYWDLGSLDCAVCKNSKSKQCGPTSQVDTGYMSTRRYIY